MASAALRALAFLFGLAPARLLFWLSVPLGNLLWQASGTRRRTTEKNLAACYPSLTEEERQGLGRASMRHFTLTVLEMGMSWTWSRRRLTKRLEEVRGLEHLESALAQGRGVLMLVPHHGNWELLNHWIRFRYDYAAVYKPSDSPALDALVLEKRTRFGAEMFPTTQAGLRQVFARMKEAGIVAILPDQDPSDGKGRFVPFFGVAALTGVLGARIVQKTGCEVVFGTCLRLPGGRYRPVFLPAEPGIHDGDMDTALAAMNRGVEVIVQQAPEQYLWAYKRFKSRPPGEPPFY